MFDSVQKPEKKPTDGNSDNYQIETMPNAFYGGQDPVIYDDQPSEKIKNITKAPVPVPPPVPKPPVVNPNSQIQKTNNIVLPKHSSLPRVIGVVLTVLILVGGAAWYYFGFLSKPDAQIVINTPPVVIQENNDSILDNPVVEDEVITTSTVEQNQNPEPILSLEPQPIKFPSVFLSDAADGDRDGLTDAEEDLFDTDIDVWDSDKDGYYDGQEIANLYNPKGFAPIKLIDSGLVKEYLNPNFDYRVYYPGLWVTGAVDIQNEQILLSGISGDYIEIRVMQKNQGENFNTWFARVAKDQIITDLVESKNRFDEKIKMRKDNLVAYIEAEKVVYVFIYEPNPVAPVAYRNVMKMIVQSFRPSKNLVTIPDQAVLPEPLIPVSSSTEPIVTTTPLVTSTTSNTTTTILNTTSSTSTSTSL